MKKIKRWKGGMDAVQMASYLHDMAAEGWILDEVGYLFFVFREEEPRELLYRVITMPETPTGEVLAEYEAQGWKKVDNWEEQYIFVRERDIWTEDSLERQMMVEELDRRIEKEKDERKAFFILILVLVVFFGLMLFAQHGTDMFVEGLGLSLLVNFGLNLLLLSVGGWLVTRRLRQKKERMLDGDTIPEKDTDWRRGRIRYMVGVALLVLLFGWLIYSEMGWDEKISDLPRTIDYGEVPAVRLEHLEEGELIRMGEDVESQKEEAKLIYGNSFLQWHAYDNSVKEYRMRILEKRIETEQQMRPVGGTEEVELSTTYHSFLLEPLAKNRYRERLEWDEEAYGNSDRWHREVLGHTDAFDETHVCKRHYETEVTHILCRCGSQVMELEYTGEAEPDRILEEIAAVFAAQN